MNVPGQTAKAAAARRTTRALRELLLGYRSLLEDALREEGLTLAQLRLLHAVSEQSEVSAATLARLCQITPQTMQAMLERAVRQGWIVRGTSERNHRFVTASLTARGKSLLARGEEMATRIEGKIWRGVSRETLDQVNTVLELGTANLHVVHSKH